MKKVICFESVDGKIFTNEKDCIAHDEDCIGEEFDALLLMAVNATNGNVTRNDQYRMCLHLLKNRDSALPILKKLVAYIEGVVDDEDNGETD